MRQACREGLPAGITARVPHLVLRLGLFICPSVGGGADGDLRHDLSFPGALLQCRRAPQRRRLRLLRADGVRPRAAPPLWFGAPRAIGSLLDCNIVSVAICIALDAVCRPLAAPRLRCRRRPLAAIRLSVSAAAADGAQQE
jgi:hypothetical protein